MKSDIAIFSGTANQELAKEIADYIGVSLGNALVDRFPEGEVQIQILDDIRGKDVYIVQPTCTPSPNGYLMELLIFLDAARRASATRLTAVLPFYGYARQDRKDRPRVPISAKLVANLISQAGAHRVLAMDLHSGQIQGFFDIPFDHLYSIKVMTQYFMDKKLENLCIVSPDVGNVKMARAYSSILGASLAIVDKRRESATNTKVMNIIGEVKGKNVIIVDDLISTGGSLVEAANALKENGAIDIYACIVHPVLAGPAVERVQESCIKELVVSNSIPVSEAVCGDKIKILSVAPLLGEAIKRIHSNESVSVLFEGAQVEA